MSTIRELGARLDRLATTLPAAIVAAREALVR